MSCAFTVDVEDWFHILDLPSTPDIAQWDRLPSRVERNFLYLLDLFAERSVPVTCFFVGWVARRFPHLVRAAVQRGHEIASHGYTHRLVRPVLSYVHSREVDPDDPRLEMSVKSETWKSAIQTHWFWFNSA